MQTELNCLLPLSMELMDVDKKLDDICNYHSVTKEALDIRLLHNQVYILASCIGEQECHLIGPSLDLTNIEIKDIFTGSPSLRKTNFLNTWIEKEGHEATHLEFIKVLIRHQFVDHASKIIQKLKQEGLIERKGTEEAS